MSFSQLQVYESFHVSRSSCIHCQSWSEVGCRYWATSGPQAIVMVGTGAWNEAGPSATADSVWTSATVGWPGLGATAWAWTSSSFLGALYPDSSMACSSWEEACRVELSLEMDWRDGLYISRSKDKEVIMVIGGPRNTFRVSIWLFLNTVGIFPFVHRHWFLN